MSLSKVNEGVARRDATAEGTTLEAEAEDTEDTEEVSAGDDEPPLPEPEDAPAAVSTTGSKPEYAAPEYAAPECTAPECTAPEYAARECTAPDRIEETIHPIDKWRGLEFGRVATSLGKAINNNRSGVAKADDMEGSPPAPTSSDDDQKGTRIEDKDGIAPSEWPKKKRKRKKRKRRKDFKSSSVVESCSTPTIDAQLTLILSRLDEIRSNQENIMMRLDALECPSGAVQNTDSSAQSQLEVDFAAHKEKHREIVQEVTKAIFSCR